MWPAVIGAAGSLLGGVLNRNSAKSAASQNRKWALQDQAEQFVRLRAAAEKGGFNPLSVLGSAPNSGMPNQTQAAQSYMGTAIADSAAMLADGWSKRETELSGKAQDLARQKEILTKKLADATLRPEQPGIFQRGGETELPWNPLQPYGADKQGQRAGLWIEGVWVPRPTGYSEGEVFETEMGEGWVSSLASMGIQAAYTTAIADAVARQTKKNALNYNNRARGLPSDWYKKQQSIYKWGQINTDWISPISVIP